MTDFGRLLYNLSFWSRIDFLFLISSICPKKDAGIDFFILLQKFNSVYPQLSNFGNEAELNGVRETIQQILRWGWKYNKNLEEQAAQLHMLTGWSLIVEVHCYLSLMMLFEIRFWLLMSKTLHFALINVLAQVSASRRIHSLENRSEILYRWAPSLFLVFPLISSFLLDTL